MCTVLLRLQALFTSFILRTGFQSLLVTPEVSSLFTFADGQEESGTFHPNVEISP